MTATVYLVRHATPDWSRTDLRYDIPPGPPLTPAGEAEAAQLGAFLKSVGVVHLSVSPLERTLTTAQIAAEIAQIPTSIVDELAEWRRGESESEVLARLLPIVEATLEQSRSAPRALVTHGGPIRVLLQDLGLDPSQATFYRRQFDHDNPLPPAGVWRISRNGDDQPTQLDLVFAPQGFKNYEPTTVHV